MRFKIISKDDHKDIFEGMIINYTVSPMFNIPLKWRTRISQVELNRSFTDLQERGPYKYWSHFHEFIPNSKGVLIKDTVDYELPFGILGNIAHRIFVGKKLADIFNFRYAVLENMFNTIK
jgi:ligand-binding SRPBCC domain-containing protein